MDLWTDFTRKFQAAFVTGDRWKLYLGGLLSTLELTVFALALGTVLGVIVAVLRSAHDQQRLGQHNPILAVLNAVCKVYTTVIRGTLGSISSGRSNSRSAFFNRSRFIFQHMQKMVLYNGKFFW